MASNWGSKNVTHLCESPKLSLSITTIILSPRRVQLQKTNGAAKKSSVVQSLCCLKKSHKSLPHSPQRVSPKCLCHPERLLLAAVCPHATRWLSVEWPPFWAWIPRGQKRLGNKLQCLVLTDFSGTNSSCLRGWQATPQLKAQNWAHWSQRETHWSRVRFLMGTLVSTFSLKRPDAYCWFFKCTN